MRNLADVKIRATTVEDAERLRALRLEALRMHPLAFTADLAEAQAQTIEWWKERAKQGAGHNSGVIMVAELDGQLVGMAGVFTSAQPKLAHSGSVWGVFVRPDFRSHGIGTQLLQACIDWAHAKKYVKLRLSVAEQNHSAERCYKKIGFVTYGIEPLAIQLDGKFYDETLMALKL